MAPAVLVPDFYFCHFMCFGFGMGQFRGEAGGLMGKY